MKTRRNVYLLIGIAFILFNVFGNIVKPDRDPAGHSQSFEIGYFIGSYFLSIIGLLLLFLASRLNKKIREDKTGALEKEIEGIGKN